MFPYTNVSPPNFGAHRTSPIVPIGLIDDLGEPLRDPIVLAAQWAALDNLSEGRSLLVACIGGGGSHGIVGGFANEYRAFGIAPSDRVERLAVPEETRHADQQFLEQDADLAVALSAVTPGDPQRRAEGAPAAGPDAGP